MRNKKQRGFTLIELLIVIAIMGLLAAAGLLAFQQSRIKARDAKRKTDLGLIRKALDIYSLQNNSVYPASGAVPAANTIYDIQLLTTFLVPSAISAMPNDPLYPLGGPNYKYIWSNSGSDYGVFIPRESGGYCLYKTGGGTTTWFNSLNGGATLPVCDF